MAYLGNIFIDLLKTHKSHIAVRNIPCIMHTSIFSPKIVYKKLAHYIQVNTVRLLIIKSKSKINVYFN